MDCTIVGDVFFDLMVKCNHSELRLVQGGTSYSNSSALEFGGAGNVAVGLSTLGSNVLFIGKAGADILGRHYQNDLVENGVKTNILFDDLHPTGISINFVDSNGERSFLISRGANDFLFPEEVELHEKDIVKSKYLYVCGFSLINSPQREAVLKAAKIAKEAGVKVVFDPGAHNLIQLNKSIFEKLFRLCDVFTPNLQEARAITGLYDVEDITEKLAEVVPLTSLKIGNGGCILIDSNEIVKSEARRLRCLDSSGAGDAFVSALIYGLIKNMPLERMAEFANWYASFNVQKFGPRSFPTREEIGNYLSN